MQGGEQGQIWKVKSKPRGGGAVTYQPRDLGLAVPQFPLALQSGIGALGGGKGAW